MHSDITNPTLRHPLLAAAALLIALAATLLGPAGAAHAATPKCNGTNDWTYHDYNGDAGIRKVRPNAGPFDYYVETPSAGNTAMCTMNTGHTRWWGVDTLQKALNFCYSSADHSGDLNAVNLGFAPLAVDGIYGPKTKAAVTAVQRNHRIKIDGVYGPQTAQTMRFEVQPLDGSWTMPICHTLFP
ncbi:peptidoglycan-binding domain-containing protein [Catellatospora paridis]|uniref:peptidoglycan-binding domain-containing protein n=1 Tax=Catellatospora paridis TaxID=1617086 RepID=UPI0012D4B1D1|nr:peptidoglycan-binding domain-containing protein [Catellatospora paridis]